MVIERRTLTITPVNAVMSFNKKKLAEIGFEAGEYYVSYDEGKVTIVKKLKSVVVA